MKIDMDFAWQHTYDRVCLSVDGELYPVVSTEGPNCVVDDTGDTQPTEGYYLRNLCEENNGSDLPDTCTLMSSGRMFVVFDYGFDNGIVELYGDPLR